MLRKKDGSKKEGKKERKENIKLHILIFILKENNRIKRSKTYI
jgi:hypothetical protein